MRGRTRASREIVVHGEYGARRAVPVATAQDIAKASSSPRNDAMAEALRLAMSDKSKE